jgi:general secretion pathway protein C
MISRANWSTFSNIDGNAVNRILPPLVSLVLVVIIGWQLAKIVWLLVPGAPAGVVVAPPSRSTGTSSGSTVVTDVQAIANAHIFGIADAEEVADVAPPTEFEDLPETRINLTLNGTVASRLPNYSVAIISDGGNDQTVYTIGDSVGNGATLHAVYADRVVLNEKGTLTNLLLPREFKDPPARSVRRTTATPRSPANEANSIQAVVTQNLAKLTDVIRPTPYRVQGQQVGFRVYPGRDRRQFAALGLRPGDIIKDIDGQALSDASRAMQIFQSLGTADQVTVTVERNGTTETLTLKTSQLDLGDDQTK